jgi:hypothetical protein
MFYRWSCDLAGELPQTSRGNVYIMIMIEHFSKWVELVALPDKSSHNTSQAIATLLWVKWEDETPTPKVSDLEFSGTPECLELNSKAQNTSH